MNLSPVTVKILEVFARDSGKSVEKIILLQNGSVKIKGGLEGIEESSFSNLDEATIAITNVLKKNYEGLIVQGKSNIAKSLGYWSYELRERKLPSNFSGLYEKYLRRTQKYR